MEFKYEFFPVEAFTFESWDEFSYVCMNMIFTSKTLVKISNEDSSSRRNFLLVRSFYFSG